MGVSEIHVGAIGFPEAANRCFGHAALAAFSLTATHFEHGFLVRGSRDAALDEATDASVFHRDVAGRTDEIALLDTRQSLLGCVAGEADIRPVQVGSVDGSRNDLANGNRILNLL